MLTYGQWLEVMQSIDLLQDHVGKTNHDNGWHTPPVPGAEVDRQVALLALIGTEVAEAIEEIRNGNPVGKNGVVVTTAGVLKPVGVPSELADIVIRTLDFCDIYNINLADAIKEKLEYNKTRGHRHGGKVI